MDVKGYMNFLSDIPLYKTEKPFGVTLPADFEPPENARLTNLQLDERNLDVYDMRPCVADFTLDTAGFMLLQQPTKYPNIDDMVVFEAYKKETEDILTDLLDPELVVCWDARLRKAERLTRNIEVEDLKDKISGSNPVNLVHTDETIAKGHESIELYLTEDQREKYMNGCYRIRMINTWRTMIEGLEHFPLAVLDYRSTTLMQDFVPYDQVSPLRHKELYLVHPRESHRWYWVSKQKRSELLVFVQYDSKNGGQARCCPHAGFRNANAPADAPLRCSVETRSIVITKDG